MGAPANRKGRQAIFLQKPFEIKGCFVRGKEQARFIIFIWLYVIRVESRTSQSVLRGFSAVIFSDIFTNQPVSSFWVSLT